VHIRRRSSKEVAHKDRPLDGVGEALLEVELDRRQRRRAVAAAVLLPWAPRLPRALRAPRTATATHLAGVGPHPPRLALRPRTYGASAVGLDHHPPEKVALLGRSRSSSGSGGGLGRLSAPARVLLAAVGGNPAALPPAPHASRPHRIAPTAGARAGSPAEALKVDLPADEDAHCVGNERAGSWHAATAPRRLGRLGRARLRGLPCAAAAADLGLLHRHAPCPRRRPTRGVLLAALAAKEDELVNLGREHVRRPAAAAAAKSRGGELSPRRGEREAEAERTQDACEAGHALLLGGAPEFRVHVAAQLKVAEVVDEAVNETA